MFCCHCAKVAGGGPVGRIKYLGPCAKIPPRPSGMALSPNLEAHWTNAPTSRKTKPFQRIFTLACEDRGGEACG